MKQQPYCLVLGGGGAKGVYHIGVWQALKELDIPVNAFIGNSIGAVISAFLVQGAEQELLTIARSMNLKSLIRLHKDKALADELSFKEHDLSYWQGVYRNVVEKRGLDTTPMRESLEANIKEDVIRDKGIDFGVTTVNLSDFKPREVFVEDMEPGELINYVMASAAFPGFSSPEIAGKKYLDGGLYDNVPFRMARRRGYRKIILVDISGIGFNRRPKTDGTQTVYIKNSIDMGNAFDFNPEFIEKFWQLGYLDTMAAFGQLVGYKYFLEPDDNLEREWSEQRNKDGIESLHSLFPDTMKHDRRVLLKTLEVCADLLDIERVKQYSYRDIMTAIKDQVKTLDNEVQELIVSRDLQKASPPTKLLDAFVKEVFDKKNRNKNPYFYLKLLQSFNPTKTLTLAESAVRRLNPELAILEQFLALSQQF